MEATEIEAILGLTGRFVWLALLHATWLGLLAAAVVAIAFQSWPRLSHRARHDASLVALISVVVCAPTVAILQQAVNPRRNGEPAGSSAQPIRIVAGDHPALAGVIPRREVGPSSRPTFLEVSSATIERVAVAAHRSRPYVLACWTLCVLSLAILLAIAMASTRRLRQSSRPADAEVLASMTRLCRLLRLGSPPMVRVHPRISEPCLCGVIRPVILVPSRWLATAASEAIDAVLAHELAHARRADQVVNLCQRLVEMLLFFHPTVRWLSRSLRRHREFCTDALAVRLTGNPLALARALESVALLRPGRPATRPFGVSIGCEGSFLYPRIQELIGMTPDRPRRRLWPFAVLPLAAALAFIPLSVGIAQDQADPPTPAAPRISTDITVGNPFPFITPPADPGLQIAYTVHFFDIDAAAWRGYYTQGMKQAGEGRGSQAWIVNGVYQAHHLLSFLEQHNVGSLLCPKVTTFDRDYASFITQGRVDQVDRVKLTGTLTPNGTQVAIDVCSQLCPLTTRGEVREPDLDLKAIHAQVMTKDFADRSRVTYRNTTEIPTGSTVLVVLGDILPAADRRTTPSKRLVLITPEGIRLDGENPPVHP